MRKHTIKHRFFRTWLVFWAIKSGVVLGQPRWVSTSPQLTELVFQLGLHENLVGTSDQSFYPKEAETIPKVGLLFNPNLEAVIAKAPDWVLWDESSVQKTTVQKLLELGIPSEVFDLFKVGSVFEVAQKLLEKSSLGNEKLLTEARKNYLQSKKQARTFSYIALAWTEPPMIFGVNTFFSNLIQEMGGKEITPSKWNQFYPKVSQEWLMAQSPQAVIYLKHDPVLAEWVEKKCSQWWPNKKPLCLGISADYFARASLTPFFHLEELRPLWELEK